MSTHDRKKRGFKDQARALKAQKYPVEQFPNRNAVMRGISILHGLGLMDNNNSSLWLHASKADEDRLKAIAYQVVESPTPDMDVPSVIRDRVLVDFQYVPKIAAMMPDQKEEVA